MAVLSSLVTVVLPVLLVAGLGVLLGRRFALDETTITRISLNGLTPALALQTVLTTTVTGAAAAHLATAYVALLVTGGTVAALVSRRLGTGTTRAVVASTIFGNNGNMGLPISLFALGTAGLDQSVVIFLTSVVLTFTVGPALYGSAGGRRAAASAVLRLPVIWAMVLGLAVRMSGLPLPVGISRAIALLASATLPMILLALGVQLAATGRVRPSRPVVTAVVLRIVLMPLLALAVGLALRLSGLWLEALVLAGAMPTAVNAYLLAREYHGDAATVADAVTVSTVASIASIAVVTAWLPTIGTW